MAKLSNARHEKFCELYVLGNPQRPPPHLEVELSPEELAELPPDPTHNATQAYIQAGYKARGNAAAVNGSRLLRREDVQARVTELRAEAEKIARTMRFSWSQLLPLAQRALRRALARDDASSVSAAKEIAAQAQGPLSLRFRDPDTGEDRSGFPVLVLGYDDGQGPPEDDDE